MRRTWILVALAVVAVLGFAIRGLRPGGDGATSGSGRPAAEFCDAQARPAPLDQTIKDINGEDVSLASFRGKVIFLNFWATWCGPCKIEIPHFVELQEKYRDQGVIFLGLSVDDPVDKLRPFVEQYRMNYPVLVGLGREDVQESFGPVWGIPVTYIIDRAGNICRKHQGLATKEQFERVIEALL